MSAAEVAVAVEDSVGVVVRTSTSTSTSPAPSRGAAAEAPTPPVDPSAGAARRSSSTSWGGKPHDGLSGKAVRFSCGSEDDAVLDLYRERDALTEGGAIWKSLTEFEKFKQIYRGRVSLVASARCRKSGREIIVKAYIKAKLSTSMREMIYREIRLHSLMSGTTGFVEFLGWFEDEVQMVLVLEHCEGGDLYRHLVLNGGQMSEEEAVQVVLYPLLKGLDRLHQRGIAHRDLKPENLFFAGVSYAGEDLRIGDLGLATDLASMRDRVGTLDYMAPEIIMQKDETHFHAVPDEGKPPDVSADGPQRSTATSEPYTSQVDVWAVGAIAYELLTSRPPFEVAKTEETAMLIVWGKVQFPDSISPAAQQFISAALTKDPKARPNVAQLLQQPWILSHRRFDQLSSEYLHWYQNRASFKGSDATAAAAAAANPKALPIGTSGMLDGIPSSPKHRAAPKKSKSVRVIKASSGSFSQQQVSPAKSQPGFRPKKHQASNITRSQPRDHLTPAIRTAGPAKAVPRRPMRSSLRSSDDSNAESDLDSAARLSKPASNKPSQTKKKTVRLSDNADSEACSSGSATPHRPKSSQHRSGSKPSGILKNRSSDDSVDEGGSASASDPVRLREMRRQSSGEMMRRFLSSIVPCLREPSEGDLPAGQNPSHSALSTKSTPRKRSDGSQAGVSVAGTSASRNSRRGSRSRGVSRAASRVGFSLGRLVSRFFDEAAPWNTMAAQIQTAEELEYEPDAELLDRILRDNGEINRKRYMEYVMRRGGESDTPKSREMTIDDNTLKELQQLAAMSASARTDLSDQLPTGGGGGEAEAAGRGVEQSAMILPSARPTPVFLESVNFSTPLETIECSPTRSPSVSDAGDAVARRGSLQLSVQNSKELQPSASL